MKEILVVSGKGGTGKTSFTGCFALLSSNAVFCDCDVDAANLHLLLRPEIQGKSDFYAGWIPELNHKECISCGICREVCCFHAVTLREGKAELLRNSCEGCGVCADHCPAGCITLKSRHCGTLYSSRTAYGRLFHAELFPGEENSGKLIAELRKTARKEAEREGADLLLSDGPPGIGCPVISSMSGVDLVLAVTEPTPSGLHDLKRLALLAHQFEIPVRVIINKWDLNEKLSGEIADFCSRNHLPEIGRVPYDTVFPKLLKEGKTIVEALPSSLPAMRIKEIWQKIQAITI